MLQCSINGGAFLCIPALIAQLYENSYWSDLPKTSYGKTIAAYVPQIYGLFKHLDDHFNTQVLRFKVLERLHGIMLPALLRQLYQDVYSGFVAEKFRENYIFHFAGVYPFLGLTND